MRLVATAVLLVSVAARADSIAPGKIPTKTVPCAAYGELGLHVLDEDPVLCSDAGCSRLDLEGRSVSAVVPPPTTRAWLDPTAEVKADTACLGTTCKPLGKHLVRALAEARAAAADTRISATANLATVVIGAAAWNVARDRRVVLAAPRGIEPALGKNNDKPLAVEHIDVAGDLLLVHWSNCVQGFCSRVLLTDGSGRALGAHRVGGGLAPIQLDATRFVVIGETGSMQLYGMKSRKLEAVLDLGVRPHAIVRIDPHTVALLYEAFSDSQTLHVAKIVWSYKPRVRTSMALPRC